MHKQWLSNYLTGARTRRWAFPVVVACACLLMFLPWAMGVPGSNVQSAYARGWEFGLNVLVLAPIALALVMAIAWLHTRLSRAAGDRIGYRYAIVANGIAGLVVLLLVAVVAWLP